jgi:hypothetical protein
MPHDIRANIGRRSLSCGSVLIKEKIKPEKEERRWRKKVRERKEKWDS